VANPSIEHMLKGEGTEIHVAMDNERAIYCEGKTFAASLAKILYDKFGINTLVGKETEIKSNVNGPIKVFPVVINNTKSNCLIIKTQDTLSALGIEIMLKDSKIHHRGIKIMSISNGRRKSGRRRGIKR
jgi:hypothetical protein